MKREIVASMIDHTLLAPEASVDKVKTLCKEARQYNFASVCVNPIYVKVAADELSTSSVKVCTVVGFPLGATTSKDKASEAVNAIENGACEIDMVISIGDALEGKFDYVENDIKSVVNASKEAGKKLSKEVIVKVILETCFLDDNTIEECCKRSVKAGADFVKTSTGFANPKDASGNSLPNGAQVHHVELMRKTVGQSFGVKASGGIRSAETAASMLKAGANRLGTSSSLKIIENWDESINI